MKKLVAMLLALCLLGSFALAENTLSWENVTEEVAAAGTFYKVVLPDNPEILYWVPNVLQPVPEEQLPEENRPVAYYMAVDGETTYALAVYALNVPSVETYVNSMPESGYENIMAFEVNGLSCFSYSFAATNTEGMVLPLTDELVLAFVVSPVDGDEEWDQVKGVIFSSLQCVAE